MRWRIRKVANYVRTATELVLDGRFAELKQRIYAKAWGLPEGVVGPTRPSQPIFRKPEDEYYHRLSVVAFDSFLLSGERLRFRSVASGKPKVSVVLILFNRAELTLGCLRSLTEIASPELEVIIVDNSSSDRTEIMLDRTDGATILRNKENLGFLLACNQAARSAKGDFLLFLNNDTVVLPGAIGAALAAYQTDPANIGAVGARIVNLDGRLQEAGSILWSDGTALGYGRGDNPTAGQYMFRRDVDYCSGAFLLTPRDLFERLGGFDEQFKPAYYEEVDYCLRLKELGKRIVYEPHATLLHFEFASATSKVQSFDLMTVNREKLRSKHAEMLEKQSASGTGNILLARTAPERRRKRLLMIEDQVPHPSLGAGFPRSHAILETLHSFDYDITLLPVRIPEEPWENVHADIPSDVEVMLGVGYLDLPGFLESRAGYFDVIVVSRPHNMRHFERATASNPEWIKGARVIYDAEAIFVSREKGQREYSDNPMSEREFQDRLKEELDLAAKSEIVLAVSEAEKRLFREGGSRRVEILSHQVTPRPSAGRFEDRAGFLFVGSMHFHPSPNSDSVIWFGREVLPRIREKLGEVELLVAGVNRAPQVEDLAASVSGIRLLGARADLRRDYETARVFVAPTRFSAGIPLKVVEAASFGLPVVATDLLAAQLGWESGRDLLAASKGDPRAFADVCIELYRNKVLWQKLRDSALDRVQFEYSPQRLEDALRRAVLE